MCVCVCVCVCVRVCVCQVNYMDGAIADVIDAMKAEKMYDDSLIVFSADNGGPIYKGGAAAANNWPLRGGKASNFEGGIRVNAWVSGGAVPAEVRGKKLTGLMTIWDWYATFAELAGADPTDHAAAAAMLPPIDSVSMLKYITGQTPTSPRNSIAVGSSTPCTGCHCSSDHKFSNDPCLNLWGGSPSNTSVAGIILDLRAVGAGAPGETPHTQAQAQAQTQTQGGAVEPEHGLWKLLIGKMPMNGWQGPQFPNSSTATWIAETQELDCGDVGCLFRLDTDPTEHHDLREAATQGNWAVLTQLKNLILEHNRTVFSPNRGLSAQEAACAQAKENQGFWGPWLK